MKIKTIFKNAIDKAQRIIISTHIHPDADGIGSEIALCLALRSVGKDVLCVNEEALLDRYKYLDPHNVIISSSQYNKKFKDEKIDLFIVTDTNSLNRVGTAVSQISQHSQNILYIDHHPCPKQVASIHCIDTKKAATGELVGELIESMGVSFTKEMALALYTSILIDTSSFRYPTVTGNTHRIIAKLMDCGVEPPFAYNKIYGTKKITYMKLLGEILSTSDMNKEKSIAWISIPESILEKYDVDAEDTHGFVNHLLILDNIKVGCMFRQMGKFVKVSFRSAGEVDVGIIAQALGGGGHDHSAAMIVEATLEECIAETISKMQTMLKNI